MAAAVTRATGGILLFLEPSLLPTVDDLCGLLDAASSSQCLALAGPAEQLGDTIEHAAGRRRGWDSHPRAGYPASAPDTSSAGDSARTSGPAAADLLPRLAADLAHADSSSPHQSRPVHSARDGATPTFAISREAYDTIGGLDARLWSVGIADDLIARAAIAGVTVRHVDIAPAIVAPPAYPLRPEIARLLSIRNALLVAFKTESADDLGETIARLGIQALLESWRGTGLSTEAFGFGGGWGRNAGALGALRHRLTGRGGLDAPLADPGGCLLPLLAIDSALDELSPAPSSSTATAIDERNAWQRMARASHHAAADHPGHDRHEAGAGAAAAASTNAHARDGVDAPRVPSRPPAAVVVEQATLPDTPTVSVVVVNWNGKIHLQDCFGSLQRSDYPSDKLELICVDNGSTDGSRRFPADRISARESRRARSQSWIHRRQRSRRARGER